MIIQRLEQTCSSAFCSAGIPLRIQETKVCCRKFKTSMEQRHCRESRAFKAAVSFVCHSSVSVRALLPLSSSSLIDKKSGKAENSVTISTLYRHLHTCMQDPSTCMPGCWMLCRVARRLSLMSRFLCVLLEGARKKCQRHKEQHANDCGEQRRIAACHHPHCDS